MIPRSFLPVLLLAAAAVAACAPPPRDVAEGSGVPRGVDAAAWFEAGGDAQVALTLGRWEDAARAWERRMAMLPAPWAVVEREALAVEQYNLACARALAGRQVAALDALEQAAAGEFGRVGFDHLARDPDLASLRAEPRWEAIARGLSWADGEDWNHPASRDDVPGQPLVVGLVSSFGLDGVTWLPLDASSPGARLRCPAPVYAAAGGTREWTTRLDPGERAAERVVASVERASRETPVDGRRVVLLAQGAENVRVAWEILLRRPGTFSAAVLDGPAPPAWALLDRGAEKMRTRLVATGAPGVPDARVGVEVAVAADLDAALAEALR